MKAELIYEGKAKNVYSTDKENEVILYYKDDATAFNGVKKALINHKGELNNEISSFIYEKLSKKGIKTHLIEKINEREQLCQKVQIIPLEFICRNEAYGSIVTRLGLETGLKFSTPILEICYKVDELNDPLINDNHAYALEIIKPEELEHCYKELLKINSYLQEIFKSIGIKLIDFKIEFGINDEGRIVLGDEISPDSCRLMDINTNEQLDKDLFRHDLGDLTCAYTEILRRIKG